MEAGVTWYCIFVETGIYVKNGFFCSLTESYIFSLKWNFFIIIIVTHCLLSGHVLNVCSNSFPIKFLDNALPQGKYSLFGSVSLNCLCVHQIYIFNDTLEVDFFSKSFLVCTLFKKSPPKLCDVCRGGYEHWLWRFISRHFVLHLILRKRFTLYWTLLWTAQRIGEWSMIVILSVLDEFIKYISSQKISNKL